MKGLNLLFLCLFLLAIGIPLGSSLGYDNNELPNLKAHVRSGVSIDNNTLNVNYSADSGLLQGLTPTEVAALFDDSGLVPYSGATQGVDFNGENLTNIDTVSANTVSASNIKSNRFVFTGGLFNYIVNSSGDAIVGYLPTISIWVWNINQEANGKNITGAGTISATRFIGNGSKITDVCLSNGTGCLSSSGNPFDQELNTTDNVTFFQSEVSRIVLNRNNTSYDQVYFINESGDFVAGFSSEPGGNYIFGDWYMALGNALYTDSLQPFSSPSSIGESGSPFEEAYVDNAHLYGSSDQMITLVNDTTANHGYVEESPVIRFSSRVDPGGPQTDKEFNVTLGYRSDSLGSGPSSSAIYAIDSIYNGVQSGGAYISQRNNGFTNFIISDDGNLTPTVYQASIQSHGVSSYLEILNGYEDGGFFFGQYNQSNGGGATGYPDNNDPAELWSYQKNAKVVNSTIDFYTDHLIGWLGDEDTGSRMIYKWTFNSLITFLSGIDVTGDSTIDGNLNITGNTTLYPAWTGWADYVDTEYNTTSRFTASDGVQTDFPNNAGTVRDSQKPLDIVEFYNGSDILGINGDAYNIAIRFKAEPQAVNMYCDFVYDIGGAVGELPARLITFPKGSGIEVDVQFSAEEYTLDTWEANGANVKVTCDGGDAEFWDISYKIFRTHKAR